MALIVLRHTRPEVADGVCYGRTDLALADDFATQAARLARELPPVAAVVSSPLGRCRALAETLAKARHLPLALEPRIREMDFGRWEGRAWAEVPRGELDAWAADLLHANPHGGETVAAMRDRVLAAQADWRNGPLPLLVVTHAGVIKALRSQHDGPAAWQGSIGFGQWLQLPVGQGAGKG